MIVDEIKKIEIRRQQRIHPRHGAEAKLPALSVADRDREIGLARPPDGLQSVKGLGVRLEPNQQCETIIDQGLIRTFVPGQRIGADVDGVRQWRAYSLTSDTDRDDGCIAITVKAIPDGLFNN